MSEEIQAVYEQGVFKPSESVDLPEGQRVVLSVAPVPDDETDARAQLAGWKAVFEGLSDSDVAEIERIALDRSNFMPNRGPAKSDA